MGDIISSLNDELIRFEINGSTATITCKKSKFDIIGISASEFPQVEENISEDEIKLIFSEIVDIEMKIEKGKRIMKKTLAILLSLA